MRIGPSVRSRCPSQSRAMFCELPEFGRCCFCLPLRQGILTFGYLNIVFSVLMVALYSHSVHNGYGLTLMYHGSVSIFEDDMSIFIYIMDIIFNAVLVYGAHMKNKLCLKTFYYYALSTTLATVLLQILGTIASGGRESDLIPMFIIGLCLNLYLLFMVRSQLKKMEMAGRTFENQLHQFVNVEVKVEGNDVYPSTVIPNDIP